jgi:hypothetical protein
MFRKSCNYLRHISKPIIHFLHMIIGHNNIFFTEIFISVSTMSLRLLGVRQRMIFQYKLKKNVNNQRGQIVIFTTILIPLFFALLGLGIDLGWVIIHKVKLQNSADLAVLAGAQSLPSDTKTARSVALDVLQKNYGSTATNSLITFNKNNHEISLQSNDKIPLYFISLLGINNFDITCKARAEVQAVSEPSSLIPLGLSPKLPLIYDTRITLWGEGVNVSGNFGLIDPTNDNSMNNPNDLEFFIANNYIGLDQKGNHKGMPAAENMVNTVPGDKGNHISSAFNQRIKNGMTSGIFAIVDWENATKGGRTQAPLLGYAYFESLQVTSNGTISGIFKEYIDVEGKGSSQISYYGMKNIYLTE